MRYIFHYYNNSLRTIIYIFNLLTFCRIQVVKSDEKIEIVAAVPEEVLSEGNEISNTDQLALESTAKDGSAVVHQYNALPGRGEINF